MQSVEYLQCAFVYMFEILITRTGNITGKFFHKYFSELYDLEKSQLK